MDTCRIAWLRGTGQVALQLLMCAYARLPLGEWPPHVPWTWPVCWNYSVQKQSQAINPSSERRDTHRVAWHTVCYSVTMCTQLFMVVTYQLVTELLASCLPWQNSIQLFPWHPKPTIYQSFHCQYCSVLLIGNKQCHWLSEARLFY